jgi:hypothetical protein
VNHLCHNKMETWVEPRSRDVLDRLSPHISGSGFYQVSVLRRRQGHVLGLGRERRPGAPVLSSGVREQKQNGKCEVMAKKEGADWWLREGNVRRGLSASWQERCTSTWRWLGEHTPCDPLGCFCSDPNPAIQVWQIHLDGQQAHPPRF